MPVNPHFEAFDIEGDPFAPVEGFVNRAQQAIERVPFPNRVRDAQAANPDPDWDDLAGRRPGDVPMKVWREHVLRLHAQMVKVGVQNDEPGAPEMDVKPLVKKRVNPDFLNLDDIRMRLDKSIILVGGEPEFIYKITAARGDYRCYTMDRPLGQSKFFLYGKEKANLNLLGPDPGYLIHNNATYNLRRHPARQQKQGLNRENSSICRLASTRRERFQDGLEFLGSLRKRKLRHFSPNLKEMLDDELLHEAPLSTSVAVYRKNNGISCEFKGRYLGPVVAGKVRLSPDDFDKSWIKNALSAVSLEAVHGQE